MSRDNGSRDREDEPGFAGRWSRLKQEAKAAPVDAEAESAATEPEAPVEDDRPDEEVLEELGLPDPDTLKSGDNFAAFMARAVPTRLRNRALRKLWISDPVLANLDELLDYGEDFTDAATVVENLQTAYQVGKGFVDKVTKVSGGEAGSSDEAAGESVEETPEKAPEEPPEELVETDEETDEETGADETASADSAAELAPEAIPGAIPGAAPEKTEEKAAPEERISVRKRMRFRLAEE